MATIQERIKDIRTNIPEGVNLVCVSKFHPVEAIREAYQAGERDFGESRVQELMQKVPLLPQDIRWHFIGHLQTNKVRDLLRLRPYLIQSVDSERLLRAINDEAERQGIVQNILLEVHVAREQTKSGFSPEELKGLMANGEWRMANVRVMGLMTMATNTDDEEEIRRCFSLAASIARDLSGEAGLCSLSEAVLSMGMSDDYLIAIQCGSTCVRIGSAIFGERDYDKPSPLRAVFFDQDGVLFDSMPFHAEAWAQTMKAHRLPFTAEDAYINEGRTGAAVIEEMHQQLFGKPASEELIRQIYKEKSDRFLQLTEGRLPNMIPGVMEVLRWLDSHGVQCWVVTGSGQHALFDNLQRVSGGILRRERMITAFDVTHGKPDPEPYLKAWQRSGFQKEACCVVENAPLGVRAGKAAGLYTIGVNTGPLPDELLRKEGADQVLPDMNTLLKWLAAR